MNKTIKLITVSILSLTLLSSCASSTDPADAYKGESPHQIYIRGREALKTRSYNEAIKRFEALEVQYPYGEETESAQLYIIYAYYMREDYPLAVAAADRFIRLHPTDPHLDYAYYMHGVANYYQNKGLMEKLFVVDIASRDISQIQKSYQDFNTLITLFPNSYYAPSAHQYMIFLRNVMANHELKIGQYYYNRGAYVASANRGAVVVTQYQGAPCVVEGLILMAKSYHRLGLTKLEQDTLSVLRYNYPNVVVNYNTRY